MDSLTPVGPLSVKSPFGGRKVVDIDTHYSEPHDLWTKRAPAKYKTRVPRVATIDGKISWVIDETHSIGFGASPSSAVRKDGTKTRGMDRMNFTFADIHAACFDAKARVALMDTCGIAAQIVYPNVLGFGSQTANKVDPEIRLISTKIYNDAMAEFQEESGQRIFPMALLPWWDCQAMVDETYRAHKMGLRGVNINPEPYEHVDSNGQPLPDLGHPHWNPFWEECQSLDIPVNFHIGASASSVDMGMSVGWSSSPLGARYIVSGYTGFFANAKTVANLIFSGLLDRYPKLKFVSVESGLGWIPFSMEYWDFLRGESDFKLQRKPSEYMKSNIYTSFWFERENLSRDIKKVGAENVMFETDFPHTACLYPIDDVVSAFSGLDEAEIDKVLSGNAVRIYHLPV